MLRIRLKALHAEQPGMRAHSRARAP